MTKHWMQALDSVRFDLGAPTPDMIHWPTVARILARLPRFNGHTVGGAFQPWETTDKVFGGRGGTISVGQHSVGGAYAILRDTGRQDHAAAFLAHDVHEYVLGDLTTPVAKSFGYYAVLETGDPEAETVVKRAINACKRAVDSAVYPAAGLPWPLDPETARVVREYDIRMCRTERDARMSQPPCDWEKSICEAEPVSGVDLSPWTEEYAVLMFSAAAQQFFPSFQR